MCIIFNEEISEAFLRDSINHYYQYNPDTLMPMLMLSLAAQGKLEVVTRAPMSNETVFASLDVKDALDYEWVQLNPALEKALRKMSRRDVKAVSAVGVIPSDLGEIYEIFNHYDTVTVVQEYHHRKGILVQHSDNNVCDKAQRQFATILMAEEMAGVPQDWLQRSFLFLANSILIMTGIQPERPRIQVADALCNMLDYDGKGVVFNPFAGCAIAAAMIGAGENLYADGDTNEKLVAVANLLCYGTGQRGYHLKQRDSTKWPENLKVDYVMSTYMGYPGGKSAFDICLGHCLENFKSSGKYAGMAAPKDIFEKQSPEMKKALDRDWVDSIVLLPFGEVAILIDAAKPSYRKKLVSFYNLTHPLLRRRPFSLVYGDDEYADVLNLSDVKKPGFLKSIVTPKIEEKDGYKIITFGQLFSKMPRGTDSLARVPEEERVLAYIDRSKPYEEWNNPWMQGIEKRSIASLFAPAFKLEEHCLIVNSKGDLEPRLFDVDEGSAFFQDGYAFSGKGRLDPDELKWLIHELNEPYVFRQLHPYGEDIMLPESFSEDQVLALKLYYPEEYSDPEEEKLDSGYVLKGKNAQYTIHDFLGNGSFGFTYSALSKNLITGEKKEVVLKEFYPWQDFHRDGVKAVPDDQTYFDIKAERIRFCEEAVIMNRLGTTPDSHIVPAYEVFDSDDTCTSYYVMPLYKDGSFQNLLDSGYDFFEDMLVKHVVIPMCKALNIAHRNNVLHLDIKPENILVDEHGDAALIDFGVARRYDQNGKIINRSGASSKSPFAGPEMKADTGMAKFGAPADIYGLAATLFNLATSHYPEPIHDYSEEDAPIRYFLEQNGYSEQFADAVVAGLQASAIARPADAQAFLNLFPGCGKIQL